MKLRWEEVVCPAEEAFFLCPTAHHHMTARPAVISEVEHQRVVPIRLQVKPDQDAIPVQDLGHACLAPPFWRGQTIAVLVFDGGGCHKLFNNPLGVVPTIDSFLEVLHYTFRHNIIVIQANEGTKQVHFKLVMTT